VLTLLLFAAIAAPSASATTFKGRYACDDRGEIKPLVGAQVRLYREVAPEDIGFLELDAEGLVGPDTTTTGADGEWSFEVPRGPDAAGNNHNYHPVLVLSSGGVTVMDYEGWFEPWTRPDDENQDDRDLQDYGLHTFADAECSVFNGLRHAVDEYTRLTGKPPGWNINVIYGGPARSAPLVDYTQVYWPAGYQVDRRPGQDREAFRVFAHMIRQHAVGKTEKEAWARGTLVGRAETPCKKTDPKQAFNFGFAEFWSGTFRPAPQCPGVAARDMAVEGNVAAAISALLLRCPAATQRRMVQVLFRDGAKIATFDDFAQALRPCLQEPLDPAAQFPSVQAAPPVRPGFVRNVRKAQKDVAKRISALQRELPGVREAAAKASCTASPCFDALVQKLRPALLQGQLDQARALASGLSAQASRQLQRDAAKPPTLAFLTRLRDSRVELGQRLARIGVKSIDTALGDARTIIARDRSAQSVTLIAGLKATRATFSRAGRTGSGMPLGYPVARAPIRPSTTVTPPPQFPQVLHDVDFFGVPDGTVMTTQDSDATFGSAQSLGFPGTVPIYVCPSPPTVQSETGLAANCPAPDQAGLQVSGLLFRLTDPPKSFSIYVGTTLGAPGGYAVSLAAYDANGNEVGGNAVLAGSTSFGDPRTGPVHQVTVNGTAPIVFVAIYFNGRFDTGAHVVIDSLRYVS
jgi:hypothetical protein